MYLWEVITDLINVKVWIRRDDSTSRVVNPLSRQISSKSTLLSFQSLYKSSGSFLGLIMQIQKQNKRYNSWARLCSKKNWREPSALNQWKPVKTSVPSIWFLWKSKDFLVAREQKLGATGHQALLEHSLVWQIYNPKSHRFFTRMNDAEMCWHNQ